METLDDEQRAIARRQRIADMLMQQSQEPLDTNQMAGGYVVPVSPLAGVAKVAQALSGAYIGRKADDREKSLSDKRMEVAKQLYSGSSSPTLADYANSGIVSPEQMVMLGSAKMTADAGHIDKMEERKFQTEAQAKQAEQNNAFRSHESQISRDKSYAQQEQMARLQSALRPKPQPSQDPLVQVMGENGQPMYLPSSQAVGRLPFNAQLAKTDEAKDAKTQGKETVSSIVSNLYDLYGQLDKSGGITNPDKSSYENVGAGMGSSSAGQTLGRLFGTKNQSIRNEITQARPLLLQQVMRATGMSARQMDSNVELKLWLATATDPTLDVKANKAALDNIDAMYGTHLNGNVPDSATGGKISHEQALIDVENLRASGQIKEAEQLKEMVDQQLRSSGRIKDAEQFQQLIDKNKPEELFKAHPNDNEAVKWAKSNPNDPRAAAILKANGVK